VPKARGQHEIEEADAVFSALAHPLRRQILLSVHYRGTCNAGDIANRFECSWPTTSRHLAKLTESGLLVVTKRGRERIYATDGAMLKNLLLRWAGYFESV
jgi:DNA-binding transcriptional ArsR family regulator